MVRWLEARTWTKKQKMRRGKNIMRSASAEWCSHRWRSQIRATKQVHPTPSALMAVVVSGVREPSVGAPSWSAVERACALRAAFAERFFL